MDEYEENYFHEYPICVTIDCSEKEKANARNRLKKCCEQFDILMNNLASKKATDRRK